MIDLHMHILPGLDDGAGDMEEAIEMARMAADSGVRMAAATPHANLPGMERGRYLQKYLKRLDEFCFELNQRRIPLKVCPGMEIFAAERLEEAGFSPLGKRLVRALKEGKLLTLNHGKYLLVEFPFDFSEKAIDYTLEELLMAGYIPVLAHPERYRTVRRYPEILYHWCEKGVVLQVNKGSVLGNFGRSVQQTAEWMLYHGLAGIIASDAHNAFSRTPELDDVFCELEFLCGIHGAKILLEENPKRILENKKVIF